MPCVSSQPTRTTAWLTTPVSLVNEFQPENHSDEFGPYYLEVDYNGQDTKVLGDFLEIGDGSAGHELVTTVNSIGAGWVDNLDGTYTCSSGSTDLMFDVSEVVVDTDYYIVFRITEYTSGQVGIHNSQGSYVHSSIIYRTATGLYAMVLAGTATTTTNALRIHSESFIGTISDISVKAVDGKHAFLTDGINLVQHPTILSEGEHKIGVAFADTTEDWSELVTDGEFNEACGVNWSCGASWSIGSGVASCTAAGTEEIYQINAIDNTKKYLFEFDITAYTSGSIFLGCVE